MSSPSSSSNRDELVKDLVLLLDMQGVFYGRTKADDIADYIEKHYIPRSTVEKALKDENHIMIDTGVSADMCDCLKDSSLECNCPAGERNQLKAELRKELL